MSVRKVQTPGPIGGVFLAQFHPSYGTQLQWQFPKNAISQTNFEKISAYVIPKPDLYGKILCVNAIGVKVKGYPKSIKDSKYARNELIFNLCFVFKPTARTSSYDSLIQKMADYLECLETENEFLSHEESRQQIPFILEQLFYDLNLKGQTVVKVKLQDPLLMNKESSSHSTPGDHPSDGEKRHSFSRRADPSPLDRRNLATRGGVNERGSSFGNRGGGAPSPASEGRGCAMDRDTERPEHIAVLYLKVIEDYGTPAAVRADQVPVLMKPVIAEQLRTLDLTTQQVLPYIDGVAHVAKIAAFANVELDLTKKCIQDLLYYEIVKLIPIFMYSNVYTATENLKELYWGASLYDKCSNYIIGDTAGPPITFEDCFKLYCEFKIGRSVRDYCFSILQVGRRNIIYADNNSILGKRIPPPVPNVDIRRLVTFGVMHGLIKRVYEYPVYVTPSNTRQCRRQDSQSSLSVSIRRCCDGNNTTDLICAKFGLSYDELIKSLTKGNNIRIISRVDDS